MNVGKVLRPMNPQHPCGVPVAKPRIEAIFGALCGPQLIVDRTRAVMGGSLQPARVRALLMAATMAAYQELQPPDDPTLERPRD